MIEDLNTIIQNLQTVSSKNDLNISDDVLFSEACSFLRGVYASKNKFNSQGERAIPNASEFKSNKRNIGNPDTSLPTPGQLKFLKENGYDGEIPKTKKRAWQIIHDYKESQKEL